MSTGDSTPEGPPFSLAKQPPPPPPSAGPAWIVVPARVVALIVLLPLRLVYDLFVLVGRGIRAVWNAFVGVLAWIGRLIGGVLCWIGLAVYRWLLAPFGRLLAAIARGLGALLNFLLIRPLRWLAMVLIVIPLRWVYRVLLAPIGRGLVWLLVVTGRAIAVLFRVLVIIPAVFLWRYVLRPPLRFLAWLARGAFAVLAAVAGAVAWSWRLVGRCLAWLAYVLVVVPVRAVWRYVLAPIGAVIAGTWRLAARVLRPIGHGISVTWRVCVGDPVRAVRRTMREAARDVRLQLRRTFRGY
ncbi:hypothetical protein GCM10022254_53270 [Actinomadura meridiana]|uniref:Integral membrane protein n=1 Tax=Actinomadura meridiana TaxID=559626 RepID=A0ABP8CEA6_9ACTN